MADNGARTVPDSFDLEELVSELQRVADAAQQVQRPPRTYRSAEIQDVLGLSKQAVMRRIREWREAGLVKTTYAPYENAWGVVQSVPMVQFVIVQASQDSLL